jgi:hypothetical protein
MRNKRNLFLALVLAIPFVIIFFSQCLTSGSAKPDPRGEIFAGSATCVKCHKDVYDSYIHTAHFTSTRPAAESTMYGDFHTGSNIFYFKGSKVVMEKRNGDLYQVSYKNGKEVEAQKFDITFGNTKAESYLYWKGDGLFQLPMSYFKKLHSWTNSPGFDTTHANFNRGIGRRCFECHASYIKPLPAVTASLDQPVLFDKSSLIMGIDCERCHGPAADHVNFHTIYPEVKEAKYIKTYASLTRSQKMDMCATCHSGNAGHMLKSIFTFKPGDRLSDFKEITFSHQVIDSAKMDVHGNQAQLLSSSKCFMYSKMDCATCHNVHKSEKQLNLAIYSQKCISCHNATTHNECKLTPQIGGMIKNNCVDCHMPARSSHVISVQTSGGGSAVPYLVRTHHIAIYKDAAQEVKNNLKKYNLQ